MAGGSFFGSSSSARVRTSTHARSGRLPLVQYPFCQTTVVKRTYQTSSNSGKKLFKCPKNGNGAIVVMPPILTTIRNTMNGMYGEMKGLRFGMAGNVALVNKNNRLGERLMIVAWLIAFLLVAILAMFLMK